APLTAGVVCGFVIAASALAWKRDFAPVLWVANVTGIAIALSLSIATHQMTPFIALLLLMVLVCEYGAVRDRDTGVRVLVALAADVAIWALIYIYASPQSTRGNYPLLSTATLLAPGLGLFLILGVSLIYRTALKGKTITVFETIQTMIAFLLAACSLIYFGPPASATVWGFSVWRYRVQAMLPHLSTSIMLLNGAITSCLLPGAARFFLPAPCCVCRRFGRGRGSAWLRLRQPLRVSGCAGRLLNFTGWCFFWRRLRFPDCWTLSSAPWPGRFRARLGGAYTLSWPVQCS